MWSARAYPVDLRSGRPREGGGERMAGAVARSGGRDRRHHRRVQAPVPAGVSAARRQQRTSELLRIRAPACAMTFGALPLAVFLSARVSPNAMQLLEANGELKRLRRSVAAFEQRTFRTPLDRLPDFVDCLLTG